MARVLFEAYWWTDGPAAVRHVMREIILSWARTFPDDEIAVLVRTRDAERVKTDFDSSVEILESRLYPQAAFAAIGAARAGTRWKADFVLTHNFAPLRRPSAVYLHDLMFKTNPEWFTRVERAYFAPMSFLAKRSQMIFTSSESEGARISDFVRGRPVHSVGIGMSNELLASASLKPSCDLVSRSFLLAVGRLNARKNLARVVHACIDESVLTPEFPLVIVGAADGAKVELPHGMEEAMAAGKIVMLGHVSDQELRWLYENARVLIYPSLGEGYGMPPLESLAFGTPVVVSDLPVMHENLGAHATFADPSSVASIGAAIQTELKSELGVDRIIGLTEVGRSTRWIDVVRKIRYHSGLGAQVG